MYVYVYGFRFALINVLPSYFFLQAAGLGIDQVVNPIYICGWVGGWVGVCMYVCIFIRF